MSTRYIHINHGKEFVGYTIAYRREDDYIIFAFSKKIRGDEYSKKTGREIAKEILDLREGYLYNAVIPVSMEDGENYYINTQEQLGFIHVSALTEFFSEELSALSVQTVDKFSTEDFKHSSIIILLRDIFNKNV